MAEVLGAVKNCTKCGLHQFRDKCVFAEGKETAQIVLIGLSPGREENSTGNLFIGPSGDFLNQLLRLAGIGRASLYITNIIKCHAPTPAIGKEEVAACSPYLDKQLEIVNPKTIIPLGSVAAHYILEKYKIPKEKITEIHGKRFTVSVGDLFSPLKDIKIVPMYHPAAALRTPALEETIKEDWRKLHEG